MITELDGLARGARGGGAHSAEHAARVGAGAARTVAYLEQQFSARNSQVRAITGKGHVLDTITFRSEETGGQV